MSARRFTGRNMDPNVPNSLKSSIGNIFLDTNVFISGLVSDTGASAAILYAAEAGAFLVFITPQITKEIRRVFIDKFNSPALFSHFQAFVDSLRPKMIKITSSEVSKITKYCYDKEDAPILAAAIKYKSYFLITLDKKAFKTELIEKKFFLKVVRPEEFMKIFRTMIGDQGY